VVIFDEVHAYDVYMQEIFCQLLAWLRAIGSSVIILSATLPNKARLEFLQAYQPAARIDSSTAKYPRLSMNDGETISTVSLGEYPDRTVYLTRVQSDPQTWIELLRVKLAEGGCAAIICNRVNRAQEIYCQIRSASLVNEDELFLLHACTPYCLRNDTEDKILKRFGKQEKAATSPRRGIVVATQVIEQSLDLDFDLLITDLAPIDLLIQRIGRLHRHTGKEYAPLRPEGLREPLCIICQPGIPDNEELPDFGKDIYVYEKAVLQRTFFTLSDRKFLQLPSDSDQLINTIYSDDDLLECSEVQNQAIHENYKEMMRNQENEVYAALNRMIGDVDCSNALGEKAVYLKENDEGVSDATRALTRNNILPSVQLVCIVREGIQTFLLDGHFPYSIQEEPYGETLDHLRRSMVTVSLGDVRKHFQYQPRIDSWRKLPSVRYAQPAVFIQGACELADRKKLILDEHLGLFVQEG
jgi:CRISPR-associated endonuclease/helicase Cas3